MTDPLTDKQLRELPPLSDPHRVWIPCPSLEEVTGPVKLHEGRLAVIFPTVRGLAQERCYQLMLRACRLAPTRMSLVVQMHDVLLFDAGCHVPTVNASEEGLARYCAPGISFVEIGAILGDYADLPVRSIPVDDDCVEVLRKLIISYGVDV